MTHQLTAAALAELDQWEAASRATMRNVVAAAVEHLDNGDSPAVVAHTFAHNAMLADQVRVATGLAWAVVALAEQARAVRS